MKISIEDDIYPKQLKNIKKPPKQLYVKGNINLLKKPGIAIIGARDNTKYGEEMAKKFAKELSRNGFVIISGMAKGIDSYAHIGCIEENGNTIAVLPSGLENIYPKENKKLYDIIIKNNGLIVTEYKSDTIENSQRFLERNRIVSGLSIGTLVIEGGYRSGTSVTARITREQGKNVFCIPSSLDNPKGITPNRLIKDGAYLVTEVEDIIGKYNNLKLRKIKNSQKENTEINEVSDEYKNIYSLLSKEKIIHINEIAKKLNIEISEISYKLMMLELEDKIISLPGSNYKIK